MHAIIKISMIGIPVVTIATRNSDHRNFDYTTHIILDNKSLKINTVKAFFVTPHEMCEMLVIYVFELIFITQFIN